MASGQRLAAVRNGIPEWTPYSRASYDAVATTARSRRVARSADDHRQPGQLRTPQHLDRRDELVEVDVQDPARRWHHSSVPARTDWVAAAMRGLDRWVSVLTASVRYG